MCFLCEQIIICHMVNLLNIWVTGFHFQMLIIKAAKHFLFLMHFIKQIMPDLIGLKVSEIYWCFLV